MQKAESETETAGTAKLDTEKPVSIVSGNSQTENKSLSGTIYHKGFATGDIKQEMVQRAYDLGGLEFVTLIECENGNWNPFAVGDGGHAHGLCQMNKLYHKIPQQYYDDWGYQIEYCYDKWSGGTRFYGPDRKIKGVKCSTYVKDRFIIS